jgi:hypothetical protein
MPPLTVVIPEYVPEVGGDTGCAYTGWAYIGWEYAGCAYAGDGA